MTPFKILYAGMNSLLGYHSVDSLRMKVQEKYMPETAIENEVAPRAEYRPKNFQTYHWEWLNNHPSRTPEWLEEIILKGFDIHHIDGDHSNNDPGNLVLIETQDHFALHGGRRFGELAALSRRVSNVRREEQAEAIYEMRMVNPLKKWADIGLAFGIKGPSAMATAKEFAVKNKRQWPIPVPRIPFHREASEEKFGRMAYRMRMWNTAITWWMIADFMGKREAQVISLAKEYAICSFAPWPIPKDGSRETLRRRNVLKRAMNRINKIHSFWLGAIA